MSDSDNKLPKLPTYKELEEAHQEELRKPQLPPLDEFGELAEKYATEIATAFQVPTDMVIPTMLLCIGMAAGKKLRVILNPYTNTSMIWLCIVARTGTGKTSATSRILEPLKGIDDSLIQQYNDAYGTWKAEGSKGHAPFKRQMIVVDSTPEARNELLPRNDLLVYRDELRGFFADINRYNQSGEVENLLSAWSGESFKVNRRTQDLIFVKSPFLCFVGGIQPEILSKVFGGKGNLLESGFCARWLFVWIPEVKASENFHEYHFDNILMSKWDALIQDIWRMEGKNFNLSEEAKEVYQQYFAEVARKLNDEKCSDGMQSLLAKMRIYILRLSLTIHLLKHGAAADVNIDGATMKTTVSVCHAFEYWGEKALEAITGNEDTKLSSVSNGDLLREVHRRYGIRNQSSFAEGLGISQQAISKYLR